MKVWLNGILIEKDEAKLTVFDHGTLYGDGVFEGIRAYGGRIFQCAAHIERLFRSAEAIRLKIPYSKDELTDAMYECMQANGISDGYIRPVITRGVGTLGLNPFRCPQPNTFIIADQLALYPEEMYANGMPIIIAKTVRTAATMLRPQVKSLNYLNNILARIEAVDAGVPEALMLNEKGNICEATGDNVFIVKDGQVMTPPPEAGILMGITRGVVMHLARRLGLPMTEANFTPEELHAADECFLTGTAAEIIAVTGVNDRPIGDGKAGGVTGKLQEAFHEFVLTDEQLPYSSNPATAL